METSIPEAASLESILCTEELQLRPSRSPEYEKENRALVKLVSTLADSPGTIFQTLAETILDITQCDSAGLSLLTRDGKTPDACGNRFYWPAIAGMWNHHVGGETPRNFGPCGDVLDQNRSLLFKHFERRYSYLRPAIPPAEECLLVPFYIAGKSVGTIWAIMHSARRTFDAEDVRVMTSLGKFASSAYQALKHIEDLKFQVSEREKTEIEVREFARGLEAKMRRLVEANVVGIVMWNLEGAITEANEKFLQMVQYTDEDIACGRVRWTDLTPAEWRERDEQALADLKATGRVQPFEKEYVRKDGSRVPVLLGGAFFEGSGNEGVAFVLDLTERKLAQGKLRESEALLQAFLENTPNLIFLKDRQGRYIFANKKFKTVFGVTNAQFIGKTDDELFSADQAAAFRANDRKVTEFGSPMEFEEVALQEDGQHTSIVQKFPLFNTEGKIYAIGGIVTDITERKREETARRYIEESYRVVVDTASDAVITADERGLMLFTNPATKRIFGYDSTELIGRPLTTLVPEFMRKLHEAGFKRYLAIGQRHINWQGTELIGMRKNGEEFPLEISFGEQIRNGHRVFTGFVRDISEKKRTEQAFKLLVVDTVATTGRDFFQSLVQHMAQALRARYAFVTTCDDQKHARTLAFWKGDGFGEDFDFDIADTPCEKVLHGEVCHYRQGLQGLFPLDTVLADWQAESYLGVPMLDRSNRVIGHIAILDDKPMKAYLRAIDLLKIFASRAAAELKWQKAEDELQAALRERERMREELAHLAHLNRVSTMGELAASLAHEIKQPISAAMTDARTCSRWLTRDRPDLVEAQNAASRVVKDVARASEIIGRVTALFKKGSSQHEAVDISELIQEMIALLRGEAAGHSISIHSDIALDLPPIMADRVQLQQVFMNLMLNGIEAMKNMNAPGKLTIRSQQNDSGQLLISVMDTGVGVPPGKIDQIFNAFFTSKPQGTGMGLPISRSIIESHGGRLWAVSNPESGTTFHFTLPTRCSNVV